MKVVSVNIGSPKSIQWNNKTYVTGIFKYPIANSIFLGFKDVVGDSVVDRKHHGGIDKACYVYSKDHYSYWINQYPKLEFENGMFGENLTIEDFDEKKVFIGDVYRVGDAEVEVSQPREPCSTLKLRFKDSMIVKKFLAAPYPGMYLRVIKEGSVKVGDAFILKENHSVNKVSVLECYDAITNKTISKERLQLIIGLEKLGDGFKETLSRLKP